MCRHELHLSGSGGAGWSRGWAEAWAESVDQDGNCPRSPGAAPHLNPSMWFLYFLKGYFQSSPSPHDFSEVLGCRDNQIVKIADTCGQLLLLFFCVMAETICTQKDLCGMSWSAGFKWFTTESRAVRRHQLLSAAVPSTQRMTSSSAFSETSSLQIHEKAVSQMSFFCQHHGVPGQQKCLTSSEGYHLNAVDGGQHEV